MGDVKNPLEGTTIDRHGNRVPLEDLDDEATELPEATVGTEEQVEVTGDDAGSDELLDVDKTVESPDAVAAGGPAEDVIVYEPGEGDHVVEVTKPEPKPKTRAPRKKATPAKAAAKKATPPN